MTNNGMMTMDDILSSKLSSSLEDGKLHISFRKTVCLRQYETEVMEAEIDVPVTQDDIDHRLPYIATLAEAKLEYSVLYQFWLANKITREEFETRKAQLVEGANTQRVYCERGYVH